MSPFIKRCITAGALLISFIALYSLPPIVLSTIFMGILGVIIATEWPKFHLWWLTPLYPAFPFMTLIWLNHYPDRWIVLLLLVAVFGHDTGAYLGGSLWGKHLLAPTISPKKSWEGFFSGLLCSLALSAGLLWVLGCSTIISALPILVLLNICAVLGDLFESALKRRAHIKDSGFLLPGHGGFLDRFDSVLLAAPALTIILYFWPHLLHCLS